MRRVVVVRHAKAVRDSPDGDRGRVLSAKGRAQAAALREWTATGAPLGDVRGAVVVSDSARTLETFELGLQGTPVCRVAVTDASLYNGARDVSTDDVLASLRDVDPGDGDLIVVAHNPTVAYVVADLVTDASRARSALVDGFPICGVAVLEFGGLAPARGACELTFFSAPRPAAKAKSP